MFLKTILNTKYSTLMCTTDRNTGTIVLRQLDNDMQPVFNVRRVQNSKSIN